MNINLINKTIVLSNSEAKKAGKPNSELYAQLAKLRADFPNFTIVIKPAPKRKESLKGLTYDYMEKYIESHADAEKNMADFEVLRASNTDDELLSPAHYGKIKKWFLSTYPEVKAYQTKIENIINKVS